MYVVLNGNKLGYRAVRQTNFFWLTQTQAETGRDSDVSQNEGDALLDILLHAAAGLDDIGAGENLRGY